MVKFKTVIEQFNEQGEKTGWTYILIPAAIAQKLKPNNKKSFRVKGKLDEFAIEGIALMPMGEGDFIMALNANIRKGIKKRKGAELTAQLEEHKDFKIEMPKDMKLCLKEEPDALAYFNSLPMGHKNYFLNWIESAKTEPTRTKRIALAINAFIKKWDYGQMIRNSREQKIEGL